MLAKRISHTYKIFSCLRLASVLGGPHIAIGSLMRVSPGWASRTAASAAIRAMAAKNVRRNRQMTSDNPNPIGDPSADPLIVRTLRELLVLELQRQVPSDEIPSDEGAVMQSQLIE